MMVPKTILVAWLLALASVAAANPVADAIYDASIAPRAFDPAMLNPAVTTANIDQTICARHWAKSVRPPKSYIERIKRELWTRTGLPPKDEEYFVLDHIVPLELGGNPRSPNNLQLEPVAGKFGALTKDRLENKLHRLVCKGKLDLATAQQKIATDWVGAFGEYFRHAD